MSYFKRFYLGVTKTSDDGKATVNGLIDGDYYEAFTTAFTSWEIREDADFSTLESDKLYEVDIIEAGWDDGARKSMGLMYKAATNELVYYSETGSGYTVMATRTDGVNSWEYDHMRYLTVKPSFDSVDCGTVLLKWLLKNAKRLPFVENIKRTVWTFNETLNLDNLSTKTHYINFYGLYEFVIPSAYRWYDGPISQLEKSSETGLRLYYDSIETMTGSTSGYCGVYSGTEWSYTNARFVRLDDDFNTIIEANGTHKAYKFWEWFTANARYGLYKNGYAEYPFWYNASGVESMLLFKEGMTWQDWVNSSYNTEKFNIVDTLFESVAVYYGNSNYLILKGDEKAAVKASDYVTVDTYYKDTTSIPSGPSPI